MGEKRNGYKVLVGKKKLKKIGRMETHDVDGRIILKGILKNQKGNKYVIPGKLTYGGRKINYFIMTKKKITRNNT